MGVGPTRVLSINFLVLVNMNALLLVLPFTAGSERRLSFVSTLFRTASTMYMANLIMISARAAFAIFNRVMLVILVRVNNLKFVAFKILVTVVLKGGVNLGKELVVRRSLGRLSVRKVIELIGFIINFALVTRVVNTLVLTVH